MEKSYLDVHYIFASTFKKSITRGLAYILSKRLSEGHICLDTSLYKGDEENPFWKDSFDIEQINTHIEEVGDHKPILTEGDLVYLNKYFRYETLLLDRIQEFRENTQKSKVEELKQVLSSFFKIDKNITDWQFVAAIVAITNSFAIITGGPGTGKTTTVAKVLAVLFTLDSKLEVGLAAPTGKAAARLNESLSQAKDRLNLDDVIKQRFDTIQASTLHRMLGYRKGSVEFVHNEKCFLPYDVVIVDESSMIDVAMMSKLMKAISTDTRLLLLGDKNQLASVEAGSVFGDLCQSLGENINHFSSEKSDLIEEITKSKVPIQSEASLLSDCVVELQKSHRFNGDVGIGKFSKDVINGFVPDYEACENKGNDIDLVVVESNLETTLFKRFVDGYKNYIKEVNIEKALEKLGAVMVLCATKEGDRGVGALNLKIEQYLKSEKVLQPTVSFYENQPVMITKNTPLLGLFNGDIGIIRKNEKGVLAAYFKVDDLLKSFHLGYLTNVVTVFAMTIHKSQGSEFRDVVVCLPEDKEMPILTRELLYTGVTRAKERVLLIGEKEVIESTIARKVERASGIQQRVLNT